MSRPIKYATAKEAAEFYLYSRMAGPTGLAVKEFIKLATDKCSLCSVKPEEEWAVNRKGDSYVLHYNRVVMINNKPITLCLQCKALLNISKDMKSITTLAARLMARRKWYLDKKWAKEINNDD